MVIHVNAENFDKEVLQSKIPVLVDFSAVWCGPCQSMGPTMDKLSKEIAPQGAVCLLDIDDSPELAMQYKIVSVPTFLMFYNGEVVETHVGTASKEELMQMF